MEKGEKILFVILAAMIVLSALFAVTKITLFAYLAVGSAGVAVVEYFVWGILVFYGKKHPPQLRK